MFDCFPTSPLHPSTHKQAGPDVLNTEGLEESGTRDEAAYKQTELSTQENNRNIHDNMTQSLVFVKQLNI